MVKSKKRKVVDTSTTIKTPRSVITTTTSSSSSSTTATTSSCSSSTTTTTTTTSSSSSLIASDGGNIEEATTIAEKEQLTDSQRNIHRFWQNVLREVQSIDTIEPRNQVLPLARIKKIMKLDENVQMISSEAPLLFAKAVEIFIRQITLRAWEQTEKNKRRTLQRSDIAMTITKYDQFDFLIDIVPREETKVYRKEYDTKWSDDDGGEGGTLTIAAATTENGAGNSISTNGSEDMQYFFQLAQQLSEDNGQATVIGAGGSHRQLVQTTAATTTQQTNNETSGGETQPAAGSGSGGTSGPTLSKRQQQQQRQQQQNLATPTTVQTATDQSITLANGGTDTSASGVANGSTTTANQVVSTNQSLQLLQHVMTPIGEITQIPLNFIGTAGTGGGATNAGQPIFIQTAPSLQTGSTIIHMGPTGVLLSANQLQQLQQQQQQQPSKQQSCQQHQRD
ncbi:nuclear transcription factor Y subunit gamma-like [Anopheles maculipalpis]|uniref:nuclear transcription factor Y subunit gamma-like n=1 Tax=Anopheles maculipalpis TaxID=1496333 RepID=UPI002159AB37|nr:nuclear transcription factor Y subunit gamma-like [Anopheles maculipalpis]